MAACFDEVQLNSKGQDSAQGPGFRGCDHFSKKMLFLGGAWSTNRTTAEVSTTLTPQEWVSISIVNITLQQLETFKDWKTSMEI